MPVIIIIISLLTRAIGAYVHDVLDVHLNTPTTLPNGQVNMNKFYDLHSTLAEMDLSKAPYPDTLAKTESAIQWGLPPPTGGTTSNPVWDYPNYVLTHLKEWAIALMIDDHVLDGVYLSV